MIPQNAPFFVGQLAMQRQDQDGWLEPAGMLRRPLRLYSAGALTEGQHLTVRTLDCAEEFVSSSFVVGPPAVRPTTVGTINLATAGALKGRGCELSSPGETLVTFEPTLEASPEFLPWLPLANLSFREDFVSTGWGAARAEGSTVRLPDVTVTCGSTVTLFVEIAGQPTMSLQVPDPAPCRGCTSGPGPALALASLLWGWRRRTRSNL